MAKTGISLLLLAALLLPAVAAAQPASASGEKRIIAEAGVLLGLPQGEDWDHFNASVGLRLGGGYVVVPRVSVHGLLRYLFVSVDDQPDSVSNSYWDLGVSGRYTLPVAPQVDGFGEVMLLFAENGTSNGDSDFSTSGLGFGARVGAAYALTPVVSLGASASFSWASTSGTVGNLDVHSDGGWLSLELTAVGHF